MNVTYQEPHCIIEDIITFWPARNTINEIILSPTLGEIVKYGSQQKIIDFPGEYDINGIGFLCREHNNFLNYIIYHPNHTYAIIQTHYQIENQKVWDVTTRLCADEDIIHYLEKAEYTGKKVLITQPSS
jgi:hypothetical protein